MTTREVDNTGTIRYRNEQGLLHRTDGPAIEYADGTSAWYVNNQLHRTDGPAVERADGTREWWANGHGYTFVEWLERINATEEQ